MTAHAAATDPTPMDDPADAAAAHGGEDDTPELPATLTLSSPDVGEVEAELVRVALQQPRLSCGPLVAQFEARFAASAGRAEAVAVASGTLGTLLLLRALGIGRGDAVLVSPYGWHQVAHAVTWAGAEPVFGEIDYWSGCLDPARAAGVLTPKVKAALVGNVNGHPAAWRAWRALAEQHGLLLLEDSTEAIGSVYDGRPVGAFGDASVFDLSSPSALCAGEGGVIVTDDAALARELRYLRQRRVEDRRSLSVGSRVPLQAAWSELSAALALAQLARLPELLARRREVQGWYLHELQSFEGIKPPYVAPDVDEVHWMLWVVHLGKRFTASACDQIVEDLAEEGIEAARYCQPLHEQYHYRPAGAVQRGRLPLTERIADRAIALPFHARLDADHVRFIVKTLKDSSVNVGAGAAIY